MGGVYVLNAQGNPGLGLVTAWAALLFSIGSAPILPLAFGIFFVDFLGELGMPGGPATLWLAITACTAGAAYFAWRDLGLSAIVMLIIEVVSLIAIALLMIVVAANNFDHIIDPAQTQSEWRRHSRDRPGRRPQPAGLRSIPNRPSSSARKRPTRFAR